MVEGFARAGNWLFRNRKTGEITIAQFPNLLLGTFIAAWIVGWVLEHTDNSVGAPATVVRIVATVALCTWSLDEIIRGVNPFRRGLGSVVLAFTVVGLIF